MSLSSENMMMLMAYADGELEGDERRDAELLIARDPDAYKMVDQLAGLGELVKTGHEDRHEKLFAGFDIADSVMKSVAEPAKVTTIAELATRRAEKEAAKQASGQGRLFKIGGAVVAAMALAASIFVVARGHKEEVPMAANTPSSPATNVAANVANAENGPGVVVESAGKSVSVFYLPTANDLSTSAVIWVDESGEK